MLTTSFSLDTSGGLYNSSLQWWCCFPSNFNALSLSTLNTQWNCRRADAAFSPMQRSIYLYLLYLFACCRYVLIRLDLLCTSGCFDAINEVKTTPHLLHGCVKVRKDYSSSKPNGSGAIQWEEMRRNQQVERTLSANEVKIKSGCDDIQIWLVAACVPLGGLGQQEWDFQQWRSKHCYHVRALCSIGSSYLHHTVQDHLLSLNGLPFAHMISFTFIYLQLSLDKP